MRRQAPGSDGPAGPWCRRPPLRALRPTRDNDAFVTHLDQQIGGSEREGDVAIALQPQVPDGLFRDLFAESWGEACATSRRPRYLGRPRLRFGCQQRPRSPRSADHTLRSVSWAG